MTVLIRQVLIGTLLCSSALALGLTGGAAPLLKTSDRFLGQLDRGDYRAAWTQTTSLFQALNQQSAWAHRQETLRTAYGPLTGRQLTRLSHRDTYAQSPDGNYVIIQYDSVFRNKTTCCETVVLDCRDKTDCRVREYVLR